MSGTKGVLLACLLGSAFLAAVMARPDWLRAIGVEVAALGPVGNGGSGVVYEPSARCDVRERRYLAKVEVVARLVAGELDLFGAAAWFRDLNHEPPDYQEMGYLHMPGDSAEEKLCRQVIIWVKGWCHGLAREGELLLTKLEAALDSRLRRGGQIELPERR
jgi:hypothetical protein